MSHSLPAHRMWHTRPPCPSPTPGVYSGSCPLSRWCHPTISSSVIPFSSCLQSFPASGSFQMSQFFPSGGQKYHIRWPKLIKWIYFWLHWVFVVAHGLSLVAVGRDYSSCGARASRCGGFSCCRAQALGCQGFSSFSSRALVHRLSGCTHGRSCSAACGIFLDQALNSVPCIGRQILTQCYHQEYKI